MSSVLHEVGLHHLVRQLISVVARHRSATDVAQLVELLDRSGRELDADAVLEVALTRRVEHLMALMYALQTTNRHEVATAILHHTITTRSPADIASLISDLHTSGRHPQSANAVITALRSMPGFYLPELLLSLDLMCPGSQILLQSAARSGSVPETAAVISSLVSAGLGDHADIVFEYSLHSRPTGHAERLLRVLRQTRPDYLRVQSLIERVRTSPVASLGLLLLALASAGFREELDAVLDAVTERGTADAVMLLKQLWRAGDSTVLPKVISGHLIAAAVGAQSLADQASLVVALDPAGLVNCSHELIRAATARHGRPFTKELIRECTKYEQKVLSRAFWRRDRTSPQ